MTGPSHQNTPTPSEPARSQPWDRQDGESDKDFSRFRIYLGLRQRTARAFGKATGLSVAHSKTLIREKGWRSRALAYDRDLAERTIADTARLRTEAVANLTEYLLLLSERVAVPEQGEVDIREIQALSTAIKNLSPGQEMTVSTDGTSVDLVSLAFQGAHKLRERASGSPDAPEGT